MKNHFLKKILITAKVKVILSLVLSSNNLFAAPLTDASQIKAKLEAENIILNSRSGDNDCKFVNIDALEKIPNFIQANEINLKELKDEELKKFFTESQSAELRSSFKSGHICEQVAFSRDQSLAPKAIACRRTNPYTFQNNKDCVAINNFLKNRKTYGFKPEKDSNKYDSKTYKTIGEGVMCQSEGSITIDFEPCVAFAKAFTTITQAQTLVHQGQEVWAQGESQTAMAKAQGNADDPKAALGAQKTGMEAQSQVLKQRAALETGKLAYLVSLFRKIPDADSLKDKVKNEKELEVVTSPESGVLINQELRDEFKQQLINIGGVAVSQMIMAKIADSRIDAIDDAMAKVDAFKPVDFNALSEDATVAYCQQNPADPKCMSGDLSYQVDPFSGESISFGAGATGTSYSPIDPNSSTASNAVNPNGPNGKKTFDSLGNVITPVDKSNNLVDTSSAATLGEGNGPQSVGGGGAGGGGAGGGGGGGGGPTGQKQAESVSAAGTNSKAAYSGGSGVSVMGGLGIGGKKSGKEEANPFADMFKNKTANANGVLNLRGPASVGKKEGNIFQQISSRYKEVSSEGSRLLEYQQAK